MPGLTGLVILGINCAYIIVWDVIYFFPYVLPVTAKNMNYSVVITGGLTIFMACWWQWKSKHGYEGPILWRAENAIDVEDAIRAEQI